MKYQVLLSLKNNEKVFISVVCCNCDWSLRVNTNWNTDMDLETALDAIVTAKAPPILAFIKGDFGIEQRSNFYLAWYR